MKANTNYNELITFLVRETGWTLEYIREIPLPHLNILADELRYLKSVDQYNHAYNAAMIVCSLISSKKRMYKPEDIIGPAPTKEQKGEEIWQLAKEAGIKVPAA